MQEMKNVQWFKGGIDRQTKKIG